MSFYDRKPVSNVLLSERLTAELRIVNCELIKLENLIGLEIQLLRGAVSKQNKNTLNFQNLRDAIGTSKRAIITFTKPGLKRQTLDVKNGIYSEMCTKNKNNCFACRNNNKNKSYYYTISSTNMRSLALTDTRKK